MVGKAGSGKTSLLCACLDEDSQYFTGHIFRGKNTKIAIVKHEPFIFHGTLKENIIFGKQYDPNLFQNVIKACKLEKDL